MNEVIGAKALVRGFDLDTIRTTARSRPGVDVSKSQAAGCGWQAIPNALGYAAIIGLVLERGAAAAPRPQTQ